MESVAIIPVVIGAFGLAAKKNNECISKPDGGLDFPQLNYCRTYNKSFF